MNQVEELERALIARAERLASAYREMTQRSRDTILREAAERLAAAPRRRIQRTGWPGFWTNCRLISLSANSTWICSGKWPKKSPRFNNPTVYGVPAFSTRHPIRVGKQAGPVFTVMH